MQAEPVVVLNKHFHGDVPEELIETIDFVLSGSREVYIDGCLLLTLAEARARRGL